MSFDEMQHAFRDPFRDPFRAASSARRRCARNGQGFTAEIAKAAEAIIDVGELSLLRRTMQNHFGAPGRFMRTTVEK